MELKSVKGLNPMKAGLGGGRRRGPRLVPIEDLDRPAIVDLLDAEEGDLLRRLRGDKRLATRVRKLRATHPTASFPELICYDWLSQQQIPFYFQARLFGGRQIRGGIVPDFIVNLGGRAIVWRIQGAYWHTRPGLQENDLSEKIRMIGAEYNGLRIEAVVDLWDTKIYDARPQVFILALAGVEMGR